MSRRCDERRKSDETRRRPKEVRKDSRQRSTFSFGENSVVGVDADWVPVGSLKKSEGGVGESTDEHVVLVESDAGTEEEERSESVGDNEGRKTEEQCTKENVSKTA